MAYLLKTNFTGGLVSPLITAREDIQSYNNSLALLKNARVLPHGGLRKRSGFKFLGVPGQSVYGDETVMRPFNYSTNQAYILVISDGYFEVYDPAYPFAATPFAAPYAAADIRDLRFAQSADVLYIVHPSYAPRIFYRYEVTPGVYDFAFSTLTFTGGPWRPQNTTAITLTPSAVSGTGITLTASDDVFTADHVGSLWALTHPTGVREISGTFTAAAQNTNNFSLSTGDLHVVLASAAFAGSTITLQRSYDAGSTWNDYADYTSATDVHVIDLADDVIYRLYVTGYGGTAVTFSLSEVTTTGTGTCRVTAYTSTTQVTADVIDAFADDGATTEWKEGAWNDVRGWPSLVCFYEDRLVFAANTESPETLWMSKTASYYDFGQSATLVASDAVSFTVLSRQVNTIKWLEPDKRLRFGTDDGEWWAAGAGGTDAISPLSIQVRQETFNGCAKLNPVRIGDRLIFVQRTAKTVLDSSYELASDSWKARDISIMAEHLFRDAGYEIKEMVFQKLPSSVLWVLREDGVLVCCTYKADQDVLAWAEVETTGTIESMALLTTATGDQLWVVVDRGTVRMVERLVEDFSGETTEEAYFLDSFTLWDGWNASATLEFEFTLATGVLVEDFAGFSAANVGMRYRIMAANGTDYVDVEGASFDPVYPTRLTCTIVYQSSLDIEAVITATTWAELRNYAQNDILSNFLMDQEVTVWADGTDLGTHTVIQDPRDPAPANYVALAEWYSRVMVGLPYDFEFQTVPLAVQAQDGGTLGRQFSVQEGFLKVYQSRGGSIGSNEGNIATMIFTRLSLRDLKWSDIAEEGDIYGLPLFTGLLRFDFPGNQAGEMNFYFKQAAAYPCTILALNLKGEVYDA